MLEELLPALTDSIHNASGVETFSVRFFWPDLAKRATEGPAWAQLLYVLLHFFALSIWLFLHSRVIDGVYSSNLMTQCKHGVACGHVA